MPASIPLYQRLYDEFKSAIESGAYPEGAQFPTERQLVDEYRVSRVTVRHAISALAEEGYLEKVHGSGTYVRRPEKPERFRQASHVRSFSGVCERVGMEHGAHVITMSVTQASPDERAFFGMQRGELVIYLRRIRSANGIPLFDENAFIPYAGFERLAARDLEDASLFTEMHEFSGRVPMSLHHRTIEAVSANAAQATLLKVNPGAPLLRVATFCLDATERPILITRNYCVGERYYLAF